MMKWEYFPLAKNILQVIRNGNLYQVFNIHVQELQLLSMVTIFTSLEGTLEKMKEQE